MNQITRVENVEETVQGLPPGVEGNTTLAVSLARAEIDQQIATSRALPRAISRAVSNILTLATLDEESAEECVYALPRGGKPIRGPSIRLAEIIASQWGNCRVGARVVHVDRYEKYVEAEGVFHDLETNTAITSRVRRSIAGRNGAVFSADMIIVTGNAAMSIAKRNAILGGVPKAVWRKAYQAVEGVIAGDIKTLVERRERAIKLITGFGVTPERICAALDVAAVDDIGLDHLTTLTGMRSAIKNGEATVEELFPVKSADKPSGATTLAAKLDGLAAEIKHDPETGEVKVSDPATPTAASERSGDAVSSAAGDAEPRSGRGSASVDTDRAAPEKGKITVETAKKSEPAREAATTARGSAGEGANLPSSSARSAPAKAPAKPATPAFKVGDDPARDESLRLDLNTEAERRAAEGEDALDEFERDLTDYEFSLIEASLAALRRKAKGGGRK